MSGRWILPILLALPACPGVPEAPNILLIITDDQRDGTMSMMPATLRWFGQGGARYSNAFTTTPACCPSRVSMLTGLYAHNHGIRSNRADPDMLEAVEPLMVQRLLHRDGYRTGLFGKYLNNWPNARDPAHFDRWATTTFVSYSGDPWNVDGSVRVIDQNSTSFIGDRSVEFLRETEFDDAQPWFLHVGFMAPHLPVELEPRYQEETVPPLERDPAMLEQDRDDKPWYVRQRHLRSVASIQERRVPALRSLVAVDDQIDLIMRTLAQMGELENTFAIFVSDNGYLWAEHGRWRKSAPYLPAIEIPMFLRWPGHIFPGSVDARLVANLDIGPTILLGAGIAASGELDGKNLLDPGVARSNLLLESWRLQGSDAPAWSALITERFQYVEYVSDRTGEITFREYYRLHEDPYQLVNLLGDDDAIDDPDIDRLSGILRRLRSCAGATCPG